MRASFPATVVTRLDVHGFATHFQRRDVGLAVADVDGDGRNELILATRAGIEIRRGDALDHVAQLLPVEYAIRVEAADVDGDGRPDLLVSVYMDEATHDVASRIYWNGPNGFAAERWTALPAAGVIGMTAGDLDGDERAEVVVNVTMQGPTSTWSGFPAYIYPGGPSRAFDPDRRLEIPSAGEVYAYAIADLDLDGYPDLVLARVFGLRIFRGGPSGIRPDDWYELLLDDPAAVCMQVHVADLNRDGWLDLVAVVQTYDDRPETRAKSTRIFWGGPDGYSLERQSVVETYSTGGAVLADVDDDGYLDLVVAEKSASLAIHHGGSGAVWPSGRVSHVPLATRGHPSTVAVADIDADGFLDLIVDVAGHYARSPESFLVLWGGADGFSADRALRHDGGYTPGQLSVADVDGDGQLELLVPAYSAAASRRLPWEIHRFDGRSLAGEPQRFPGLGSCHVLPIDLDGDGRIDLIVSNHRDDDVHTAPTEIYWNGPAGISRTRDAPARDGPALPHDPRSVQRPRPFPGRALYVAGAPRFGARHGNRLGRRRSGRNVPDVRGSIVDQRDRSGARTVAGSRRRAERALASGGDGRGPVPRVIRFPDGCPLPPPPLGPHRVGLTVDCHPRRPAWRRDAVAALRSRGRGCPEGS